MGSTNNNTKQIGKINATGEGTNPDNSADEYTETNDLNKSSESVKKDHRRSRSLDNLIDSMSNESSTSLDNVDMCGGDSKSMENILRNNDDSCIDKSDGSFTEKPCEKEVITIDNSINLTNFNQPNSLEEQSQNDSGIQCCSSDNDESFVHKELQANDNNTDDNVSMSISTASSDQKDEKNKKKFLDKYVKKVRKLMKK